MAGAASATDDPLVEPAPAGVTRAGGPRVDAIDMLRGLVIVLMVLDHVRDFFHIAANQNPTDPTTSWWLLYVTRWVTHLCAPTFVLLAGTSIFFQKANGKAPSVLPRFLVTRGLWLLLLEATLVTFGFNFGEPFLFLQVIWAIGFGMICMAVLTRLPTPAVLALGIAIIALHGFAQQPSAGAAGLLGLVRLLMLSPGPVPGAPVLVMYPALPWLGILCLGYGLGPLFRLPPAERRPRVAALALALLAGFAVLRVLNGYGDPVPWTAQAEAGRTVMSFLNISKYPPSPDYVMATLGVSLSLFLLLERLRGPIARILLDFGRTPLFTYLAHIYLAHGLMLATAIAFGRPEAATNTVAKVLLDAGGPPWGFSLAVVYAVWALVVAMLIPLSRWFAGVKRRRRDWWLGYL